MSGWADGVQAFSFGGIVRNGFPEKSYTVSLITFDPLVAPPAVITGDARVAITCPKASESDSVISAVLCGVAEESANDNETVSA